jgi:fructokinase
MSVKIGLFEVEKAKKRGSGDADEAGPGYRFHLRDSFTVDSGSVRSTEQRTQLIDEIGESVRKLLGKGECIDAVGIGWFGPMTGLARPTGGAGKWNPAVAAKCPKVAWRGFEVAASFSRSLGVPMTRIAVDTDVNAPALDALFDTVDVVATESPRRLAGSSTPKRDTSCAYITVGTGIGIGLVIDGQPVHGIGHPEGGHSLVQRVPADLTAYPDFSSVCEVHSSCAEGLASIPSLAARLGVEPASLASLPDDHAIWELLVQYTAQLCMNLTLFTAVHRIVLGGGVFARRATLVQRVRETFAVLLNGYVETPPAENFIVQSQWGDGAGLVGGLRLAAGVV